MVSWLPTPELRVKRNDSTIAWSYQVSSASHRRRRFRARPLPTRGKNFYMMIQQRYSISSKCSTIAALALTRKSRLQAGPANTAKATHRLAQPTTRPSGARVAKHSNKLSSRLLPTQASPSTHHRASSKCVPPLALWVNVVAHPSRCRSPILKRSFRRRISRRAATTSLPLSARSSVSHTARASRTKSCTSSQLTGRQLAPRATSRSTPEPIICQTAAAAVTMDHPKT